jgi:PilZ domain
MSQAAPWLEIAVGVLPPLPVEVRALRDDGGLLTLTLLEPEDGALYCTLSTLDAREGLRLTIPVERSERGGYSIGCEISDVFFMGGLDSAAHLTITEVTRRKPYRLKQRIETNATVTLHVITSSHHPVGTSLTGRVIDISSSGIGFTSETPLEIGDRLRIDTTIEGVTIHAEATVVQTSRAAFGRHRAGCQFTRLPLPTQHAIDAIAKLKAA